MGFFSWQQSDTGKSIANKYTEQGATPCKMLMPSGMEYTEHNYQGYGVFGDHDYFEMVDRLNGGAEPYDRDRGIDLDLEGGADVIRPKFVSIGCKTPWEDLPESPVCESQGYWL